MLIFIVVDFSYIQYSAIAARVVRKALKEQLQADAAKRDITGIKFVKWEGGKAVGKFSTCMYNIFRFYLKFVSKNRQERVEKLVEVVNQVCQKTDEFFYH